MVQGKNLQDKAKAVLRGKCTTLNGYTGKEERSKINFSRFYPKKLKRKWEISSE